MKKVTCRGQSEHTKELKTVFKSKTVRPDRSDPHALTIIYHANDYTAHVTLTLMLPIHNSLQTEGFESPRDSVNTTDAAFGCKKKIYIHTSCNEKSQNNLRSLKHGLKASRRRRGEYAFCRTPKENSHVFEPRAPGNS